MKVLKIILNVFTCLSLFLPISIANIIFGLILKTKSYKYKSNLIIGIIFSVLLFAYGSMYFIFLNMYSNNKSYLYELEERIDVDFPNEFEIITEDWTKGKQTSNYLSLLKYISVVTFDEGSIPELDSNIWKTSMEESEYIPIVFTYEASSFDKFMVYSFNTNEYNPTSFISNYDYVVIAYDIDTNKLIIYEYYIK